MISALRSIQPRLWSWQELNAPDLSTKLLQFWQWTGSGERERIGSHTSSVLSARQRARALSPLLFTLHSNQGNSELKYMDDTAQSAALQSGATIANNLQLSVGKTAELIVGFRTKEAKTQTPHYITAAEVEQVNCFPGSQHFLVAK